MTLLIVSPAYAPYVGVGANRMMSFSKYLISKGYKVIVLRNSPETWPSDSLKSVPPEGVITRDVFIKGHFDECVACYYDAIKEAYSEYSIDCAVYSCNPYYTIVAAEKLKKEFAYPFIIDFRDLWVNDEAFTRSILKRIRKSISRQRFRIKERRCIAAADHIVTVTPRENDALKKQYPRFADKMSVIYNGYDNERLECQLEDKENEKVNGIINRLDGGRSIGVFGKFGYYDYEYLVELLNAVKGLNKQGIKIKIIHIGDLDGRSKSAMEDVNFPSELYIGTGFLDYKTGMEILKNVSMNSLIVHYKRGLGTKLFDYIYVDKPVIYFAPPDSAIADIMKTCAHSYRCDRAEEAIKAIRNTIENGYETLDCSERDKYSRTIQNKHYEALIKGIGGKSK